MLAPAAAEPASEGVTEGPLVRPTWSRRWGGLIADENLSFRLRTRCGPASSRSVTLREGRFGSLHLGVIGYEIPCFSYPSSPPVWSGVYGLEWRVLESRVSLFLAAGVAASGMLGQPQKAPLGLQLQGGVRVRLGDIGGGR